MTRTKHFHAQTERKGCLPRARLRELVAADGAERRGRRFAGGALRVQRSSRDCD